jgi:hypothetical protein
MSIKSMANSAISNPLSNNKGVIPILNGWAKISSPSSDGTYTDSDGTKWVYWKFTSSGTLVVSESGLLDILLVGGGGNGSEYSSARRAAGGAGGVAFGIRNVPAASYSIVVPGSGTAAEFGSFLKVNRGGNARTQSNNFAGGFHALAFGAGAGAFSAAAAGSSAFNGSGAGGSINGPDIYTGLSLEYDGSSVVYGEGGIGGTNTISPANVGKGGNGGSSRAGGSGVMICRVRI